MIHRKKVYVRAQGMGPGGLRGRLVGGKTGSKWKEMHYERRRQTDRARQEAELVLGILFPLLNTILIDQLFYYLWIRIVRGASTASRF